MAWHLFRLGSWSFRKRKLVASFWVLILILMAVGAGTLSGNTNDNFELSGIESTEAFALIKERSPQAAPDGATARIVFGTIDGSEITSSKNAAIVSETLSNFDSPSLVAAMSPFETGAVSKDGKIAYATVTYDKPSPELKPADRSALEELVEEAEEAGLAVLIGGDALQEAPEPPLGELVGIAVAIVVLVLTLGSLVAAGMPLATALVGVGIGTLGITTLTGFMDLSSTTPALGSMLGLAVGVDYALFIMSRYQHEIRTGRKPEEAAGIAVGTAGSAVIFAGATVVIALAGLAVCGIGFLTQMGLAAAAMVALAVLIALTLLPAILGFAGHRVVKGRLKFLKDRDPEGDETKVTNGLRWVRMVSKFRWPVLIAGTLVAAIISIPVASLELAIPDDGSAPIATDRRAAYDAIAGSFGEGANGPLTIVVDTADAKNPSEAVNAATAKIMKLAESGEVAAVIPPLTDSSPQAAAMLAGQLDAVQFATITVIPKTGPSDAATQDLVATLRADLADLPQETGARALVTGQTAVGVDIAQKLSDVFPLYLAIVVGLAFLLLVLVFRSILVPLKAALGFLLSLGVSLGATVAVFQWGWMKNLVGLDTSSPVVFILPILLTGVLFGLAMDYEVFLVTRMREAYVHGIDAKEAVIVGFQHSARVVTAAAVIMGGVFIGFAFTPDPIIKTIGFALAVGVLTDAFLVRMTLVPALMAIVGKPMWWIPKSLDRVIPNLDVEGEALMKRLGPVEKVQ